MCDQTQQQAVIVSAAQAVLRLSRAGLAHDQAMAALCAALAPLPLQHLARWERWLRWMVDDRPPVRAVWRSWQQRPPQVSWLTLCSRDGYARERALCQLRSAAPNGFFLAVALRRLNDWVPQVRAAARAHLPRLLQATDPVLLAEVLCRTLPHWASWQRMTPTERAHLTPLLALPALRQPLLQRLLQSAAGPMATVLQQVGRSSLLDADLPLLAHTAVQPALRARAYRCLLQGQMCWVEGRVWQWQDPRYGVGRWQPVLAQRALSTPPPFLPTLQAAMADRSARVRRVAGEMLVRHAASLGADARPLAQRLAADRCPLVAAKGRFVLAQRLP